MVWSRDTEAERPPLSVILPQLYLGAESDVTQERLASLGISYVLSVSRCSPQPSFLPHSRFLRIPIDDSLWDDLLPWIPQALRFIDVAVSSGASVLVHCAAGVSRSPALAVAYIMYSLGMDLDQAYRFVKDRRPSISPNFNFLGQLLHFQDTLCHSASSGRLQQLDTPLPSCTDSVSRGHGQEMNRQDDSVTVNTTEVNQAQKETVYSTDTPQHRHTNADENGNQRLSLSGKLRTFHLTLNLNQKQVETTSTDPALSPCEPVEPSPKPTQLQLPSCSSSLAEKRKSLALSLTPLGSNSSSSSQQAEDTGASKTSYRNKTGGKHRSPAPCRHTGDSHHHGQSSSYSRCSRAEVQDRDREQGALLLPFTCTLNKLLDWGERVLLGGLFIPPVRMGQAALP